MNHLSRSFGRARQRGVVLIIAMVMLVVISLLAALSIRNALSSESVSGNVRTTELATQSAEIALRFCENAVAAYVANPATTTTLPTALTIHEAATPPKGVSVANWDSSTANSYALPLTAVNQAAGSATFKRPPECIVERLPVVNSTSTALDNTSTFLITARGFGPEVAADATRGRPEGSEIWLQSTFQIQTP